MAYADNKYSFMFILNKDWQPAWQLHNARGHVAVSLGAQAGEKAKLLDYEISALNTTVGISHYPVIDKGGHAKDVNRLFRELQEAPDGITYSIFTDSMFGASAEEQLQQTKQVTDPSILVIGMFGETEKLKVLSKRLSLATF
jgi:hypothetical protein